MEGETSTLLGLVKLFCCWVLISRIHQPYPYSLALKKKGEEIPPFLAT